MIKVAIIGAGSAFTRPIVADILGIKNLDGGCFALVDIDGRRLTLAEKLTKQMVEMSGKSWQVTSSTERAHVLSGADFVINQIEVHGLETVKTEFEIPLKYGVKQCIGDTLGPGGLFKTLRTLPAWLEILEDIHELAPNTIILNYTNPMSAITLATTRVSEIPVIGLCHSVQETSRKIAELSDVPYEELKWQCAGINHMSWFTTLEHNNADLYPVLIEKMADREFVAKDPVRLNAMKHLGAFVTESSGHFSEYVPYFRKRQDLIDKHCSVGYNGGTGFYANEWPLWRRRRDEEIQSMVDGNKEVSMKNSHEYAAIIIDAVVSNKPQVVYGNVLNTGLISNLPQNGVVETACLVNRNGIQPCSYGALPEHLAALNRSNMAFFEMVVSAVLSRDKTMAERALMLDPLTAAVCSLDEIHDMFNELYSAERRLLAELH